MMSKKQAARRLDEVSKHLQLLAGKVAILETGITIENFDLHIRSLEQLKSLSAELTTVSFDLVRLSECMLGIENEHPDCELGYLEMFEGGNGS